MNPRVVLQIVIDTTFDLSGMVVKGGNKWVNYYLKYSRQPLHKTCKQLFNIFDIPNTNYMQIFSHA